jgi:hypothetical protein
MSLETVTYVAHYYNMSVFHYQTPDRADGHSYMLEINPDYGHTTPRDKLNGIEVRWIDMDTGIFVDITIVRPDEEARAKGVEGALMVKDGHRYNVRVPPARRETDADPTGQETDLFPLRDSVFEGVPAKIPNQYAWLLEKEYSKASLTRQEFLGWVRTNAGWAGSVLTASQA